MEAVIMTTLADFISGKTQQRSQTIQNSQQSES